MCYLYYSNATKLALFRIVWSYMLIADELYFSLSEERLDIASKSSINVLMDMYADILNTVR